MINPLRSTLAHRTVTAAKRLWYGGRGEPIRYGPHDLRYLPGTRPTRLKYVDSPDETVRTDVAQLKLVLDGVKPGDRVLDVGGHAGQYAVLFAALVGAAGRVATFEPDAAARAILEKNVALNGFGARVRVESVALSDRPGTHRFFSRGGNSQSSLVRSGLGGAADESDVQVHEVTTVTLDDYLAGAGLPTPAWVKIDTEGAEVAILKGAARFLAESQATVMCELHPYAWPEFGVTFDDLLRIVHDAGRVIRYIDPALKIADGPRYGATVIASGIESTEGAR